MGPGTEPNFPTLPKSLAGFSSECLESSNLSSWPNENAWPRRGIGVGRAKSSTLADGLRFLLGPIGKRKSRAESRLSIPRPRPFGVRSSPGIQA